MFVDNASRAAYASTAAALAWPSALSYAARFLPQRSSSQLSVACSCCSVLQLPASGGGASPFALKRSREISKWAPLGGYIADRGVSAEASAFGVRPAAIFSVRLSESASSISLSNWGTSNLRHQSL